MLVKLAQDLSFSTFRFIFLTKNINKLTIQLVHRTIPKVIEVNFLF